MVRIAEVVEEGRPLPAARCHMPRRYVGLGTCRAGHCCYCRLRSRVSVNSHGARFDSLPPPASAATTIHHTHPSFVAMDTDMEPRDGKPTLRLHG